MRTIVILFVVLNTIVLPAFTQKIENAYDGALTITSSALLNDEKISNYSLSVFLDGHRLDSVFVKNKKTVKMYLDFGKSYTFLFQKQNCSDKIVVLNTKNAIGLNNTKNDVFNFQVELTKSVTNKNIENEDLPIAVIMLNQSNESLSSNNDEINLTRNK